MMTKKTALLAIFSLAILLTIFYSGKWDPARGGTRGTGETRIQGRVVSQYGPLENARVRVQGDDRYALTDRQGMFALSTKLPPGGKVHITAGKEGWFNNVQIASPPSPMRRYLPESGVSERSGRLPFHIARDLCTMPCRGNALLGPLKNGPYILKPHGAGYVLRNRPLQPAGDPAGLSVR